MKTVALDVHSETSQMTVVSPAGEILLEMKLLTRPEDLRRVIAGIDGPKRVVFEEGPMSGMIKDALAGAAEEIVSCDPTQNALIARAEDKNDERDALRLAVLSQAKAIHPVYVPPEPYRTLRSLVRYDHALARSIAGAKNRIKALCRRLGIRCRGIRVYSEAGRKEALGQITDAGLRWQAKSIYRQLKVLRTERLRARKVLIRQSGKFPEIERLKSIPGVGPVVARTIVAWVVDPLRFKSRNALSSYGGLGLGQGWTNWQPIGRARASKKGQRELKRVLFIAARGALLGENSLTRRYQARTRSGWEDRKAIRDLARCILMTARAVWITGKEYDDAMVSVPEVQSRCR